MASIALRIVAVILSAIVPHVLAAVKDGPIAWDTGNPDGSPSEILRRCALRPFGNVYSIDYTLTCRLNSCVCRGSLSEQAHAIIRKEVQEGCGKVNDYPTVETDIEQAIKFYHDYCAANGYPISASTTKGGDSTCTGSGHIATVTVYVGGAVALSTPTWSRLVFHSVKAIRKFLRLGIKRSILWLPAGWSLALVVSVISAASKFWLLDARSMTSLDADFSRTAPGPDTTTSSPSTNQNETTSQKANTSEPPTNTDSSTSVEPTNTTGVSEKTTVPPSTKDDLSTLEIVGIVLGIIFAVITTIATVYMCWRMKAKAKGEA